MIDEISLRFRFDRPFKRLFRNQFSELAPRPQHSVQKIPSNGMQNLPTNSHNAQKKNNTSPIKFSSLSAPTKKKNWQPDQTKKHSAAPPGIEPKVLRILVARSNHWATKPQRELRVNFRLSPSCQLFFHYWAALCFFVWSGCQFFYLCRCWKRREFDRNDPDKSEFTNTSPLLSTHWQPEDKIAKFGNSPLSFTWQQILQSPSSWDEVSHPESCI